jgi:hypothetical protein
MVSSCLRYWMACSSMQPCACPCQMMPAPWRTPSLCAGSPASGPLCPFLTTAAHHAALQGPASQLGIRIKWPNDIYYGSFKIGGILLHTSFQVSRLMLLECTGWRSSGPHSASPCAGACCHCVAACMVLSLFA